MSMFESKEFAFACTLHSGCVVLRGELLQVVVVRKKGGGGGGVMVAAALRRRKQL